MSLRVPTSAGQTARIRIQPQTKEGDQMGRLRGGMCVDNTDPVSDSKPKITSPTTASRSTRARASRGVSRAGGAPPWSTGSTIRPPGRLSCLQEGPCSGRSSSTTTVASAGNGRPTSVTAGTTSRTPFPVTGQDVTGVRVSVSSRESACMAVIAIPFLDHHSSNAGGSESEPRHP